MGKSLSGKSLGTGLSQRPDGRYQARATINGVKICLYNKSLSQLKKDFEQEKAKVLRHEHNVRPEATLAEFCDEWFNEHKRKALKSEVSRRTYWRRINNTYIDILGLKKVSDIKQNDIQIATNELIHEKGYKIRTVREALGMLRECLDIATVNGLCRTNPCVRISLPNNNEAMEERRVLDKWEVDLLLEVTKGDYYEEVYKFLLSSGVRVGEMSGLQWGDIDFDKKIIKIQRSMSIGYVDGKKIEILTTPKTAKAYRDIPFFPETESILKSWKQKQDMYKKKLGERWRMREELGDLVFSTSLGSPLVRYAFSHSIEKVEKEMQALEDYRARKEGRLPRTIDHMYAHSFRHTFCSMCLAKGMDTLVVQKIMGHSDFATTLTYTHLINDKRQKEVEKIGSLFD